MFTSGKLQHVAIVCLGHCPHCLRNGALRFDRTESQPGEGQPDIHWYRCRHCFTDASVVGNLWDLNRRLY